MKRFSSLALFCLLTLGTITCQAQQTEEPTSLNLFGFTMGTIEYNVIVAHHPDSVDQKTLQDKVHGALERVNGLMSTYIPDSDVSRFNDSDSTDFVTVDSETAIVVNRAIEISLQTDGAFDITVGPAVDLWKFGPDKSKLIELPEQAMIEKTKSLIGYEKLEVRLDPPGIRKTEPGLKIDLSAIAKGYAVDQVAKELDDVGSEHFMVEVGGEVLTRGNRASGGPWRVGVERPNSEKVALTPGDIGTRELSKVAGISNKAMATSGDYRSFFEFEGRRYSHTIDPKTCKPVEHGLATACIVAEDCMTADAIATAVSVLGVEKGKSVCEKLGVEFLLIERDSDFGEELTEHKSEKFPIAAIQIAAQPAKKVDARRPTNSILPAFIGAAVIIGLAILGMAVGSIFGNKPVQGSCGGLANMTNEDGESNCSICAKPTTDCVERDSAETVS